MTHKDEIVEVGGYRLAGVTEDEVIGIFNEDRGPVVVYFSEFKGSKSVHVRVFWMPDGKDYYVPTKRGAYIPPEEAEDVANALFAWAEAHGFTSARPELDG